MKAFEAQLTPNLTGKLWLLLALFTVLLPHFVRMPLLLSLGCGAILAWRLAHELKGWALPRRPLRIAITLAAFLGVAALFKTVVGRDAGVALLSVMLCLKLLELRTLRDAMVSLYLGYFLVIGGFLFSQSIYNGIYLLLVVVLLTAALIVLNHPHSSPSNSRYYLRYAGQLLLQAFPIMVVLFLLFPRLNAPLWHMPQGAVGKTGLSDQIAMGTISSLVESEEVAFRVDFKGDMPPADQLYWRGPVLWYTDGRLWQRMRQQVMQSIPQFEALSSPIDYTVTLESNGYSWLFTLDLPLSMPRGLEGGAFILPDFQMLAEKPATTKQRYDVSSITEFRNTLFPDDYWWSALQLPQGVNNRSVELAQAWVDEGLGAQALIDRALSYFRDNDFYYTRQPPLLGDNPVDDFLFNSRRGFCEHYATAFVTLMRAAGIPARVVTGYQGGERNKLGNYLIVRQSSAHAWAEVWLEGRGWLRIDPTSNIPVARVEEATDTQRFTSTDLLGSVAGSREFNLFQRSFLQARQMWDAVNHGWNQWVLGFDREQQDKLLRALGMKQLSWKNLLMLLVGGVILLTVIISAIILLKRPAQRDPVQRQYQLFCQKLARLGTSRRGHEGPQDFARRACMELPTLCAEIHQITSLYVSLRYRQQPQQTALVSLVRAVKRL